MLNEVALAEVCSIIVWDDSTFIACDENTTLPDPDDDGCPDGPVIDSDLSQIAASAASTTAQGISYPNAFRQVRFTNGERRWVLGSEMGLIDDCVETGTTVPIDSSTQLFNIRLPQGGGNATLDNVLALRAGGFELLEVDEPDPHLPQPGPGPVLPTNPAEPPTFTFFIYDHLGNSRVLYTNELRHCDPDSTKYLLEHVLDYYPFGKSLREYVHERERFQTTYHERDEETGLDYRGARFYDGEVGRFLSVDPLALDFAEWGTYVYTLDNPIRFIDPDGRAPDPPGWLKSTIAYLSGVANSISANMAGDFPGQRRDPSEFGNHAQAASAGQTAGDIISLGIGAGELILSGAGLIGEGLAAIPSGGGSTLAVAPTLALGAHGAMTGMNGVRNLMSGKFDGGADTENATSSEAFRNAKDQNGVPRSQQPDNTTTVTEKDTGKPLKQFEFTNSKGEKVIIRKDNPRTYPDGGKQGPHYNAGKSSENKLRQHHNYEK